VIHSGGNEPHAPPQEAPQLPEAHFVVDASVVAKWYLPDEADAWQARVVRQDWERGTLDLVAPTLIRVEVPRALQLAVRDGRVAGQTGGALLENFLSLDLPCVPSVELVRDAFRIASTYRVALYDALYCALAEQIGWQLLLTDERLIQRLRPQVNYFLTLEDWHAARSGRT
jgi:predicted nucleic acid-binding protein